MALVVADRIKEITSTTGTGTYTLGGGATGFESFATIGNGNTTYYCCTDGTDFEVGIGTYTASGTTLARTTILESSNSDDAVNWGSGNKDIFVTQPAEKAVYLDASGNIEAFNASNLTAINASNISSGTLSEDRLPSGGAGAATYGSTTDGTKIDTITLDAKGRVTAVATGNTGDIRNISVGTGLDGGGSSGNVSITLDLSEFTDMTADMVNTDEFIVLDGGAERRKAANEIPLSIFNNDSGFTTNVGDITGVTAGTGLSGGGSSGAVTLNVSGLTISELAASSLTTSSESFADNDTTLMTSAAINDRIESFGYSTTTGTVTSVGTTGTVNGITLTGTVTSSGNLTLGGTLGSITVSQLAGSALTTSAESFADNDTTLMTSAAINDRIESFGYTTNVGDITGVTAGSGLTGGGTSGTVTLNHEDTSSQASVNNSGRTYIQDVTLDTYGHVTGLVSATETVTDTVPNDATITLSAGVGLSGGGNFTTDQSGNETITFTLDMSELTDMTATMVGTDEFIVLDNGADRRKAASEIGLSIFNNDSGFITSADGGNAQTLDSLDSTQFLRSDAADTKTSGNLVFNDNVYAQFGTSGDLNIFHNASNSFIRDVGTGALFLDSNGTGITLRKDASENMAKFLTDGAVELYYDNSKKLETTSTGATVTGDFTLTSTDAGATVDPSLILHRDSASPADFDIIGNIQFDAENSASEQTTYAQIYSQIVDQTDGTEDGYLQFWTKVGGTDLVQFRLGFSTADFYGNVRINPSNVVSDPALIFEGSTANDFETFVRAIDPTADRTINLPNASGTVLTTGNSDTPTTTTSSGDADFILVDDGGTMKKITPANLGITSGSASKGFAVAMAIAL